MTLPEDILGRRTVCLLDTLLGGFKILNQYCTSNVHCRKCRIHLCFYWLGNLSISLVIALSDKMYTGSLDLGLIWRLCMKSLYSIEISETGSILLSPYLISDISPVILCHLSGTWLRYSSRDSEIFRCIGFWLGQTAKQYTYI